MAQDLLVNFNLNVFDKSFVSVVLLTKMISSWNSNLIEATIFLRN